MGRIITVGQAMRTKDKVRKVDSITVVEIAYRPAADEDMDGNRTFEVRIYNQDVRDIIEAGEPNKSRWSNDWADAHYHTVRTKTPELAIKQLYTKYPEREGFVITHVVELGEAD